MHSARNLFRAAALMLRSAAMKNYSGDNISFLELPSKLLLRDHDDDGQPVPGTACQGVAAESRPRQQCSTQRRNRELS